MVQVTERHSARTVQTARLEMERCSDAPMKGRQHLRHPGTGDHHLPIVMTVSAQRAFQAITQRGLLDGRRENSVRDLARMSWSCF
jgi:hypothetical protein